MPSFIGEQADAILLEDGTGSDLACDATWLIPEDAEALLVLAHGAGADHRHASMSAIARAFCDAGIATLRFNFPFMQQRKRRVDAKDVAMDAIARAQVIASAQARASGIPRVLLGGHSFGGRMSTHAVAELNVPCDGLILCSFPLHPARKPSTRRAAHLADIRSPMLFLSGTRDDLADADLLTRVVGGLHDARLHWLDTGNHSYATLKRTRTHALTIFEEMAEVAGRFVRDQMIVT